MSFQLHLNTPLKVGKEEFTVLSYNEKALVFQYRLEPGGFVPQHIHKYCDELFEMQEGVLTMMLKSEKRELKAGESHNVITGHLHGLKNNSKQTITCKVTYSPAADSHKMIACMQHLFKQYPKDTNKNLLRAFYVGKALGWLEFSSPGNAGGRVVFSIIGFVVNMAAALGGWKKMLPEFQEMQP